MNEIDLEATVTHRVAQLLQDYLLATEKERSEIAIFPGQGEDMDGITRPGMVIKLRGNTYGFGVGTEMDVILRSIDSIVEDRECPLTEGSKPALEMLARILAAARERCTALFNEEMFNGSTKH